MQNLLKPLKKISSVLLTVIMICNIAVIGYAQEETTGELLAAMSWKDDFAAEWKEAADGAVFDISDFESGDEAIRYIKIENQGAVAFSYELGLATETEVGELASLIDVYFSKDINQDTQISQMGDKIGTLAEVINKTVLADGKIEAAKNGIVAIGLKMHEDVSSDYMGKAAGEFSIKLDVQSADKFFLKFENTDKYLYRVGNANPVELGSLFGVKEGANIGSVSATITSLDNSTNVSWDISPNTSDWTKSTIQFSGTGPVAVTISDKYANPLTLNLEVVDAKNATTAASATANNVVLLNDVSGTFTVSNGYTFYGNGFTVKLPTSSVTNVGNGFTGYISIGAAQDDGIANGGNLDNVRIEGPVYPEMYIYRDQAKITDTSDADYGDGYNMRYFKNSVIVYGGNCTISNSYISGSRTALCLRGGNNVVVENTTLSGGAYANMQICAGSSVTLRNLTTVQTDVADSYGKGKTVHGLGIAVDSNVVDIYIEGELNQYNWLCEEQWNSIVPSSYRSIFPKFFTSSTFNKYWHYLDGGTSPYVNIAFIYACNWDISRIYDNRTTVDYATCDETIAGVSGGVYSKTNTVGGNAITDLDLADPGYTSPGFNPVAAVLDFDNSANNDADDAGDAADEYCVYDESNGTLKVGIAGDSKILDLSKVAITKNGASLEYTAYLNGTRISNPSAVTIDPDNGTSQILSFKATSNDAGYDKDGIAIDGSIEYTWTITVEVATLSYPAPVWNMGGTYKFDKSNCYYAYYKTSQGYGEAVPIYEGIKVNYYNKSGTLVELDLSGTTTLPTGSNNVNANAFTYTLNDGSTLTMKYSSGWKSGATTHQFTTYNNKAYVYPQSLDNDNYVRAKTTNQDFDVKLTYTFTDPNGQSTNTVTMNWYNAKESNGNVSTVQWKTFDSTNGKEDSCLAEGTLITLADGKQKAIEDLTFEDELLVWDFFNGEYTTTTPSLLINDGEDNYEIIKLNFDDDSSIRIIYEHGLFDVEANDYVYINKENVAEYQGHKFIKNNGMSNEIVTLDSYSVTKEYIGCYTILTAQYNNCIANGLLTVTPPPIDGWYDYFEIGEGMKYDEALKQQDIEEYGLYTYDDFSNYISYEEYVAFNGAYLKILVGKGYFTFNDILEQIQVFGVGSEYTSETEETEPIVIPDENEPVALAEVTEKIETVVIEFAGNTVTAASYKIDLVQNGNILTLTATGNATTGYAIITLDGDDYYTNQIAQGDAITVTVDHLDVAQNQTATAVGIWGNVPETVTTITNKIDLGTLGVTINGATATLSNTTKYGILGDVYMAVYNGNQLLNVSLSPNFTIDGKKDETYNSGLEIPEGATVRVFVWSPGTMMPILK